MPAADLGAVGLFYAHFEDLRHTIKTDVPVSVINGTKIQYPTPSGDVEAFLQAIRSLDGTLSVEVCDSSIGYDTGTRAYQSYGYLTQEEFDRVFPDSSVSSGSGRES